MQVSFSFVSQFFCQVFNVFSWLCEKQKPKTPCKSLKRRPKTPLWGKMYKQINECKQFWVSKSTHVVDLSFELKQTQFLVFEIWRGS